MDRSLIIFLIWLALAAIGVISKAVKNAREKGNGAPAHKTSTLDEILEHIQQAQSKAEQSKATKADWKSTPGKIQFTPADEGIASTTPVDTTPAAKPKKGNAAKDNEGKMDFDPVDMVIYSEIMQPGYEKY